MYRLTLPTCVASFCWLTDFNPVFPHLHLLVIVYRLCSFYAALGVNAVKVDFSHISSTFRGLSPCAHNFAVNSKRQFQGAQRRNGETEFMSVTVQTSGPLTGQAAREQDVDRQHGWWQTRPQHVTPSHQTTRGQSESTRGCSQPETEEVINIMKDDCFSVFLATVGLPLPFPQQKSKIRLFWEHESLQNKLLSWCVPCQIVPNPGICFVFHVKFLNKVSAMTIVWWLCTFVLCRLSMSCSKGKKTLLKISSMSERWGVYQSYCWHHCYHRWCCHHCLIKWIPSVGQEKLRLSSFSFDIPTDITTNLKNAPELVSVFECV